MFLDVNCQNTYTRLFLLRILRIYQNQASEFSYFANHSFLSHSVNVNDIHFCSPNFFEYLCDWVHRAYTKYQYWWITPHRIKMPCKLVIQKSWNVVYWNVAHASLIYSQFIVGDVFIDFFVTVYYKSCCLSTAHVTLFILSHKYTGLL